MWRNEMEIDDICDALRRHPTLAPWALVLRGWVDNVNSHSDGWPYWKAGSKAADKLSDMLARAAGKACSREHMEAFWRGERWEPTVDQLRASISPMKACATRHKMPQPEAPHEVAESNVARLQAQLVLAQREAVRARDATAKIEAATAPPPPAKPLQVSLWEDAA